MNQILTKIFSALILLHPLMAEDDILQKQAKNKQMGCYSQQRGEYLQ